MTKIGSRVIDWLEEILGTKEIKRMSQALDDAFANVNTRLDAQDAATTANTVLLQALVAAVQANPQDPTVVSRLQEVADRIDVQTKKVADADAANAVPVTP